MATKCNNEGIYPNVRGKQRKAAEMLTNPDFDGNITELCNALGVARSTLYRWFANADFNGYVNWLIERYTDSELPRAWKSLVKKIGEGNVEAMKLFFAMKDKYKEKLEIDSNVVFISGEDKIAE